MTRSDDALGQLGRGGTVCVRREHEVGKLRLLPTEELAHLEPQAAAEQERKRSDEAVALEGQVDGEGGLPAVVAPPLEQPPVEEIRTWAGHRPDEVVPGAAEGLEAGPLRNGLGPQHGSGPV
jgi:hypothetical protein